MPFIPKAYANKLSVYLGLILLLFFNLTSNGQIAVESKNLMQPKSTIVSLEAPDGSYNEYYFYDDAGRIVKMIRHDQFESKHPICKLEILKNKLRDSLPDYYHVLPMTKGKDSVSGLNTLNSSVVDELNSLKRLDILVKSPEKARVIIGCPTTDLRPVISMPSSKYLTRIETVKVLDFSAEETEGHGNALLDCSYVTIYNYLGEVFKEILVPDKIVTSATISDDGNYLMCSYAYTLLWEEGVEEVPEGILIADLISGKLDYISTSQTKNSLAAGSILFADNYFQLTIGNPWSGDPCVRLYINPYNRMYYIKLYGEDRQKKRKPILPVRSFIQFEGTIESLVEFNRYSY